MKTSQKTKYLLFDKHFLVITLLTLGIVFSVSVMNQQTQTKQNASQSINLNSANEIDSWNNPDGTMGPKTADGNYSKELPNEYQGYLSLNISDLPQIKNSENDKSLQAASLNLTITKAEAHLIRLFIPGTITDQTAGDITNNSGRKTNQNVNRWETLQLNNDKNNVTELTDGLNYSLGTSQLAGGKYSEIRIYISKAAAVMSNGQKIEISVPANGNIIRIVRPFNIFAGKTTALNLNFDKQSSLVAAGDRYFLTPVIRNLAVNN